MHRRKAPTVRRRRPEPGQCCQVLFGSVALVAIEAVPWMSLSQPPHVRVPMDLRDDRRGRNRRFQRIASDDRRLRMFDSRDRPRIDENVFGNQTETEHCTAHRLVRRVIDIQSIDLRHRDRRDRYRNGLPMNRGSKTFACFGLQFLRVIEPLERCEIDFHRQHHCSRNQRACQRPNADFIDPRDELEPVA